MPPRIESNVEILEAGIAGLGKLMRVMFSIDLLDENNSLASSSGKISLLRLLYFVDRKFCI